ncbi:MAG: hypothetical protein LBU14_04775 [Candidatus Peribacteria bacterium]|jgi:hypothetical protein|nr:hypothetical protein [Candidatus Peribacteria bacterium]
MSETKITENQVDELILDLINKHSKDVIINEEAFLDLLKCSLSLNVTEKKRVIGAVPTLSQFQFNELTKVFTEERKKFKELAKKYPDDIKKLLAKQQSEWMDLGEMYKLEKKKEAVAIKEKKQIDDMKKSLGV